MNQTAPWWVRNGDGFKNAARASAMGRDSRPGLFGVQFAPTPCPLREVTVGRLVSGVGTIALIVKTTGSCPIPAPGPARTKVWGSRRVSSFRGKACQGTVVAGGVPLAVNRR
jgi:hypothetical protein